MYNDTEVTLDRPLPTLAGHTGAKGHPASQVTRPAGPHCLIGRTPTRGKVT
ncbi:hypothetical protein ACFTSF_30490 [Kribbella sp. NPDC056951]|uniref:hypothetical protein n=1 Tax=Kribbella sp. NPDC056951 TaxID=3345978 RepID=UPI003632CE8C